MNLRKSHQLNRRRRGAAAVEFAVSIAILLAVVFASIEFVRLNLLRHSVDHASYLAARQGIILGARVDDVRSVARDHLALHGVGNAVVSVSPNPLQDDSQLIEVNIDVPISENSWISPLYFNGTINARTRMLAERGVAEMSAATPSTGG